MAEEEESGPKLIEEEELILDDEPHDIPHFCRPGYTRTYVTHTHALKYALRLGGICDECIGEAARKGQTYTRAKIVAKRRVDFKPHSRWRAKMQILPEYAVFAELYPIRDQSHSTIPLFPAECMPEWTEHVVKKIKSKKRKYCTHE